MRDFVNVQKALLDSLGITKLYAVMGASMARSRPGMAASYPDMVPRLVSVIGTPGANAYAMDVIRDWADPIRVDPKWNNGDYTARRSRSRPRHGAAAPQHRRARHRLAR